MNLAELKPGKQGTIIELDKNYFLKDETADQRVNRNKDYLIADIESYKEFSLQHSIETVSKKSLK